jgi:carbonic anhydrase
VNDQIRQALSTQYSRRFFGQRAVRWSMAGGVALIAAACGAGVSKEDLAAVEDEVKSLQGDVKKLKSGSSASTAAKATDSHAAAAPAADAHGAAPAAAAKDAHAAPGAPAHWTYAGKGGPTEWGTLASENAVCGTGSTQSPIDISFTQSVSGGRTTFKWNPSAPLSVVNNGHTIQANVDKGSKIEIDGVPFDLLQFHFHAPSEHTVDGKQMAMETHFVHKSEKGELAVIGVMHALGAENGALASIWNGLPRAEGDKKAVPSFDLLSVLPRERAMFRYAGSLTTPPCSEGVRWHVIQAPTSVSPAQVSAFMELFKDGNSRPVQPIKARDILKEAA